MALSTAAVALAVLVGTSVVVYHELGSTLTARVLGRARTDAARLARLVDTGGGEQHGTAVSLTDPELISQLAQPGAETAVLNGAGHVIQTSTPRLPPLLSALAPACLADGHASKVIAREAIACVRVGPASRAGGAIVSVVPLADRDETLAAMRGVIAVALGGAFVLVLGLAWAATRRALAPLARIARTAGAVGAGATHLRIRHVGPRDEVGVLADELDRSYDRLAAVIADQASFLAEVSHELRTPLAASRAHVELLDGWAGSDAATRGAALVGLRRSIARMTRLVDDLLHVAHGEGGPGYTHAAVMLDDLLIEVHNEACSLARDVDVVLRIDECPVVSGDRDKLYQLVTNVVDNALRHTPPGGTVRLELSAAGSEAAIRISDTGPGIAADVLPRIFERRFQGASGSGRGGAGLGLAIAWEIARAHRGGIAAHSAAGRGATITVTLPVAGAVEALPAAHA